MYLNITNKTIGSLSEQFNYNMGCIWMVKSRHLLQERPQFNYNMGCIWIIFRTVEIEIPDEFNYNMGCIWIWNSRIGSVFLIV